MEAAVGTAREEAREKALEEAREQARNASLQNAKQAKVDGISVEIIAKCTGLTIEEVESL